ncbi:MAG: hypothetical protein ABI234_01560 [Ktedonobacteraceae bacterium]
MLQRSGLAVRNPPWSGRDERQREPPLAGKDEFRQTVLGSRINQAL